MFWPIVLTIVIAVVVLGLGFWGYVALTSNTRREKAWGIIPITLILVFLAAWPLPQIWGFSALWQNPEPAVAEDAVEQVPAPAPTADAEPELDPVPESAAAEATPELAQEVLAGEAPMVTRSDALALLEELDQIHNLTKAEGFGNDSFRFDASGNGNATAAAFFVTQSGTLEKLAFVCDDVCLRIVLVRGNNVLSLNDKFQVYTPEGKSEPHYGDAKPMSSVTAPPEGIDQYVGLRPTDTLAGWVAADFQLEVMYGDYIVVEARDDDTLNVEVGITSFFKFRPAGQ